MGSVAAYRPLHKIIDSVIFQRCSVFVYINFSTCDAQFCTVAFIIQDFSVLESAFLFLSESEIKKDNDFFSDCMKKKKMSEEVSLRR